MSDGPAADARRRLVERRAIQAKFDEIVAGLEDDEGDEDEAS